MKKVLVGTFYTLQGVGNLIFALSFFTSGGDPRVGFALGFFLLLPSISSLLAVLLLFLRREDWALAWGKLSSVLFIFFYGLMVRNAYDNIVRGITFTITLFWLIVSLIIVVLNVVSVFGLYNFAESKRIQH
jgi:hypothetical protein